MITANVSGAYAQRPHGRHSNVMLCCQAGHLSN